MKKKFAGFLKTAAVAAAVLMLTSTAAFGAQQDTGTVPDLVKQASDKNVAKTAAEIDKVAKAAEKGKVMYNGWQVMTRNEDDSVTVIKASEWYDWSDVAELCREYGYAYGGADFYYDNPAVSEKTYSKYGPILICAEIDGREYRYYFLDNRLIRRTGPEGTSDNIKTNEFLNRLYHMGVADKEPGLIVGEDTRDFTVTARDDIRVSGSGFRLTGTLSPAYGDEDGDAEDVTLTIDASTELVNADADSGMFPGFQKGDSAARWYRRLYNSDNPAEPCGIFKIDVTGNHIDRIYGSFWWD
ncbi:MAG: hypothetical protein K6E83_05860 [Clostridium sp.]|nr:hypothetical protein [Clostridium sp.]